MFQGSWVCPGDSGPVSWDPSEGTSSPRSAATCAAVVGLNTSAFIEAGIVGRSVHTILLPQFAGNQTGTVHFRYLLTAGGGLLNVAHEYDEHLRQLEDALAALERSENAALPELMAEDARLALRALGRITGRVDVEDLLDIIFRDFCIGK